MYKTVLKTTLALLAFILFTTGCSSKKYFDPEDSQSSSGFERFDYDSDIVSIVRNGATLQNGQTVCEEGILEKVLPEGFEFLNINEEEDILLASNKDHKLMISTESNIIDLGENVIAASLKNGILALIFIDNSIALYDTKKNKFIFKEYLDHARSVDTKITNPLFLDQLFLFPTLDGKVLVVDINKAKAVKSIVVDTTKNFKNITFLKEVDDKLIAASNNKIISVGTGVFAAKDYEIKDVIAVDDVIYLATIDGKIIKLSSTLDKLGSKKYKFAKFYALGYGTSLYALESQGYLIQIDKEFKKDIVYDFSFDEEEKSIALKDKIYFGDRYLQLK